MVLPLRESWLEIFRTSHHICLEDIHTSSPLSKVKPINPQDTERNIQPAVKGLPATNPNEDLDHNKGKTSSEVEPDIEPFIPQTFGEIQALLEYYEEELKDTSDEEMYEAREEMDNETQLPLTDPKPTEEE
nr:hypothetical protein [Tanacetum cinerariifolium]